MTDIPSSSEWIINNSLMVLEWTGVFIFIWLYLGFCVLSLANRFGRNDGWLGFIPIVNLWYVLLLAGMPGWLVVTILIPPVYLIVWIFAWWKMSEKTGKPGWIALLLLIPIVNVFMQGYITWG